MLSSWFDMLSISLDLRNNVIIVSCIPFSCVVTACVGSLAYLKSSLSVFPLFPPGLVEI